MIADLARHHPRQPLKRIPRQHPDDEDSAPHLNHPNFVSWAVLPLDRCWYAVPGERHGPDRNVIRRDGRHIGYLTPTPDKIRRYGRCDRDLWEWLSHLVGYGPRCLHCAEQAELLALDTQFYRAMLYVPPRAARPA